MSTKTTQNICPNDTDSDGNCGPNCKCAAEKQPLSRDEMKKLLLEEWELQELRTRLARSRADFFIAEAEGFEAKLALANMNQSLQRVRQEKAEAQQEGEPLEKEMD